MARTAIRGNPCLDALLEEFECYGITDYDTDESGPHIKVRWRHQGHHNCLTVAKSSSDRRAPLNLRSDLRKQLHTAGIPRLSDLAVRPKTILAFPKAQPTDGMDEKIRRLAAEMGAVTDWLLDLTPAIHKLEQFTGMADAVADSCGLRFRLRADVSPSLIGPLIAYLLTQGVGMEDVKLSHIPAQAAPEKPPLPRIALPPKPAISPIPAFCPPPIAATTSLPAELPAQPSNPRRGRSNGSAREKLLSHLNEHGPQTTEQLRAAGLRGWADREDRLTQFLSHLCLADTPPIRRRWDQTYELTSEGKAFFKKPSLPKNHQAGSEW
jgi:hypothetical protein